MSERAYYRVDLTSAMRTRTTEADGQGIQTSRFAHETPQWRVAPDGTYGLLRVHWPTDKDRRVLEARALFEARRYVTPITDIESASIAASWSPPETR